MSDNAFRENTRECFCKSATINDSVKLNGQVDPGSAVCTIRASAVIKHCFNPELKVVELYGFGADEPIFKSTKAVRVTLEIDSVKKADPYGKPTLTAHPARFSPEDKYSKQRITIKKRFNILLTQTPEPIC
ncbi:hypothetical protein FQA39_LY16149 [Lamprigera yunnana]|nr:hypothetical protein FQA39_LY16149 [Lamprigera yunnana]